MTGFEALEISNAVLEKTLAKVDDVQQKQSTGRVLIGRIREMCGIRPSDSQEMAAIRLEHVTLSKDETRNR